MRSSFLFILYYILQICTPVFAGPIYNNVTIEDLLTLQYAPNSVLTTNGSGNIAGVATLPISKGGTGQTTATASINALLPTQTGNSGKYLKTDGTNTLWDIIPTISFPLNSGTLGSPGAPVYQMLDNDSGMYQTGDGNISFSCNGFNCATLNYPGNLVVPGTITAANYPPTGTAGTAVGFNSLGTLASIPGWNFDVTSGAPNYFLNKDIAGTGFTAANLEAAIDATADGNSTTAFNIDDHFDRANAGFAGDQMYGLNVGVRHEGSGGMNYMTAGNFSVSAGTGNGATIDAVRIIGFDANIGTGSVLRSMDGQVTSIDTRNGILTENLVALGLYNQGPIGLDFTGLNFNHTDGAIGRNSTAINYYQNSSSTVAGDFHGVSLGIESPVTGSAYGMQYFQSGKVSGSWAGYLANVNGDISDSDSSNHVGFDVNFGGGTSYAIKGNSLFGFNFNNNDHITTANSRIVGMNINNGTGGTSGSFLGLGIFQQANTTDEKSGINMNLQGDSRTTTGINITMSGAAVDDVQALRINVNGQTTSSATNHVKALDIQGGQTSIFGDYKPFNASNVEIGNGYSITSTIDSGSPLTGTDQILQLIQSNLLVNDDINTGPFGLDTNMIGAVSQVAVSTGKNVPILRGMLLGTSVPQGSGGTIGKYVTLELLGLPSFGGSVTNLIRYAIEDGSLLGQNYCDGATDCRFINVQDSRAQIKSASGVTLSTSGAQPTCDVDHRGQFWNIEGGTGVADILQICQKDATDTYVWITK